MNPIKPDLENKLTINVCGAESILSPYIAYATLDKYGEAGIETKLDPVPIKEYIGFS